MAAVVTRRHYDPRDDRHVRAVLEKNARALLSYLPDDDSRGGHEAASDVAGEELPNGHNSKVAAQAGSVAYRALPRGSLWLAKPSY